MGNKVSYMTKRAPEHSGEADQNGLSFRVYSRALLLFHVNIYKSTTVV